MLFFFFSFDFDINEKSIIAVLCLDFLDCQYFLQLISEIQVSIWSADFLLFCSKRLSMQHNGQKKRDKQRSTKYYTKNLKSSNTNPTKNWGWTWCSRRVSGCAPSSSGTCHAALVTNLRFLCKIKIKKFCSISVLIMFYLFLYFFFSWQCQDN